MKKRGRFLIAALSVFSMVYLLTGCQSKNRLVSVPEADMEEETKEIIEVTTAAEPEANETQTEVPDERIEVDGKIQSYLTGEMVDVAKADRRPIAVMISNDKESMPSYGINRAGVIYEAPVEGGMVRYMALIEDYDDLERIGSVRSARTYYIYFAREFNAILTHCGQSTFAKPYLKYVDDINALEGAGGAAFYRSKDKRSPHNAYTSFKLVQTAADNLGFSQDYDEDYAGHYRFAKPDSPTILTQDNAVDAYKIYPGYQLNNPYFLYDENDGLYHRYQYGAVHSGDEGPLTAKNIIIQYCQQGYYATTPYLNINVHNREWGYYATNGKAMPVYWVKDGEFGVTHYYDFADHEIELNPGKTWVCIVSTKDESRTELHGKE
ncbi:DUF3048 domain-containing protein [Clostridium sp. AM58-1XD]|uniref:DUF3048 domain-containing protein n=1 Tax=Clostridium sp. AM58-1XD TaxID=2292307 RepID=UPI000E5290C9|nr:DUF3048 domain-containing protein [Clostridium sp. AM58-1XD]RGZ01490.1 DUF3048 domain-containing protein [Clostridium sp. AM58-1XD]